MTENFTNTTARGNKMTTNNSWNNRNLNLEKWKPTRSDWILCTLLGIFYGTLLFLFIK